jgi:hypothetical protein
VTPSFFIVLKMAFFEPVEIISKCDIRPARRIDVSVQRRLDDERLTW